MINTEALLPLFGCVRATPPIRNNDVMQTPSLTWFAFEIEEITRTHKILNVLYIAGDYDYYYDSYL